MDVRIPVIINLENILRAFLGGDDRISSSNLRERLFSNERGDSLPGFPGFNRSLCYFFAVPALRDVATLKRSIFRLVTLRNKQLDDNVVRRLILYSTGGISCFVHEWIETELTNLTMALIKANNIDVISKLESYSKEKTDPLPLSLPLPLPLPLSHSMH